MSLSIGIIELFIKRFHKMSARTDPNQWPKAWLPLLRNCLRNGRVCIKNRKFSFFQMRHLRRRLRSDLRKSHTALIIPYLPPPFDFEFGHTTTSLRIIYEMLKVLKLSNRGGLEVERWSDNRTLSISVDLSPLGAYIDRVSYFSFYIEK